MLRPLTSALLLLLWLGPGEVLAQAVLTATPAEVPAGGGAGHSRIQWKTADGTEAELVRVNEDGSLQSMGRAAVADIEVDLVSPGKRYEYRLMSVDGSGSPLAVLTVTGTYEVDPALNWK